jgi:hypothetical protein
VTQHVGARDLLPISGQVVSLAYAGMKGVFVAARTQHRTGPGERAELADMRGFGSVSDLRQAFRDEQIKARDGTKGKKPFFHVQLGAVNGEGLKKLSLAQWAEIANRCDKACIFGHEPPAARRQSAYRPENR